MLVKNGDGATVRTLASGATLAPGAQGFVWNGRKDSGTKARSGTYLIEVLLSDGAGNEAVANETVVLRR